MAFAAELGGALCTASELKRLMGLLRSFPTTAAQDRVLLEVYFLSSTLSRMYHAFRAK